MFSLIYIIFAILGLSFLIFIHEFGHYWMARRVGMKVEVFSIGFGRPLIFWMRDGVKWQVGWLPFGGYVKIAGTETAEGQDPYEIKDGFFGKTPWDRAKVAFMGPLVNLVFALLAFSLLWIAGGREKNFSEFTTKLGWIDPKSELYQLGIRPGDEITGYDDYSYMGQKDHVFAPMLSEEKLKVNGNKVNYATREKIPFEYELTPYTHPNHTDKGIKTIGVLDQAGYLIYDRVNGKDNPFPEGAPLANSGLQYGDRLFWVDGELIFSNKQLQEILNDSRVFVTVKRGNELIQRRVPRVQVQELRPTPEFREEIIDWQHTAGIKGVRYEETNFIPYNLTFEGVVEERVKFLDQAEEDKFFAKTVDNVLDEPLVAGDRIIAVQGVKVVNAPQIIDQVQQKKVNIIVERDPVAVAKISWNQADESFNQAVDFNDLNRLAASIGTDKPLESAGQFILLKPVTPLARARFPMSEASRISLDAQMQERRQKLEQIEDPKLRQQQIDLLKTMENSLVLGLPTPQDRKVIYNPGPTELFGGVTQEISRTMEALVSGRLPPKYISGPVGIVTMVQSTLKVSLGEALFWLGAISLNLGVLNLLPIPVLDGGTIVFSFYEMITRRRMSPKAMENLVFVFAILLIGFFLMLTYQDVARLFNFF